jgi:ATP-dependent protease ClpP protease subunit
MKKMKIVNKSTSREVTSGWFGMKAIKASANAETFDHVSLHIFGEIGWEVTAQDFVNQLEALGDVETIEVEVGSVGGNVWEGLAIYNALITHKAKISMLVTSLAASMASVIVQAASPGELRMLPSSMQMIHNPAVGVWGDQHDHEKAAEALSKIRDALVGAYLRRFNGSQEELIEMLDAETWLTADDCIANGLADELVDVDLDIAACLTSEQITEVYKKAPKEFLAFIDRHQSDDGSEDKATALAEARMQLVADTIAKHKQSAAAADANDEDHDMTPEEKAAADKAAREAEAKRQREIRAAFAPHNVGGAMDAVLNECVDNVDCTVADANARLLKAIGEGNQPAGGGATTVVDARDKFQAGAAEAIAMRMGAKPTDHSNEFVSQTLMELCRTSATLQGKSITGMNKQQIVAVALQPGSDFPGILENVASKQVLRGYEEAPEVYSTLARIGNLPDFKIANRSGLGAAPSFPANAELQEVETIEVGDRKQSIQLATYAARLGLSRQAIINDDLNEFGRLAMKIGGAARRTVGDRFANVFTQHADGQLIDEGSERIFASSRNNTGTGGVPSTAAFTELRTLMKTQSDVGGNAHNLNINPRYIFCPVALEGAAQVVAQSELEVGASTKNNTTPNVERNRWEIVSDSRLDAASALRYYALGDPNVYDTIEVAFLDGVDAPQIQQVDMYDPLGVYWVSWIDCVAQPLDFRAMAVNDGS